MHLEHCSSGGARALPHAALPHASAAAPAAFLDIAGFFTADSTLQPPGSLLGTAFLLLPAAGSRRGGAMSQAKHLLPVPGSVPGAASPAAVPASAHVAVSQEHAAAPAAAPAALAPSEALPPAAAPAAGPAAAAAGPAGCRAYRCCFPLDRACCQLVVAPGFPKSDEPRYEWLAAVCCCGCCCEKGNSGKQRSFNDMFTRMAGGSAGGAISREQFAAFLQENGRQLLGAEEEEEEELQALLSDVVDEAFQTTAQLSRAQFIAFLSSTSDAPCLDADAPPGPPGDADLGGGGGSSSSSSREQGASIQSNSGADGPAAAQVDVYEHDHRLPARMSMNTTTDCQQEHGAALRGMEGGEEMYADTNGISPTLV